MRTKAYKALADCNGILVPGGFGERGIVGMVRTCKFARESKKPFLGICLGMQVAVIEAAQNILGWKDAESEEHNKGVYVCVCVRERKNEGT